MKAFIVCIFSVISPICEAKRVFRELEPFKGILLCENIFHPVTEKLKRK